MPRTPAVPPEPSDIELVENVLQSGPGRGRGVLCASQPAYLPLHSRTRRPAGCRRYLPGLLRKGDETKLSRPAALAARHLAADVSFQGGAQLRDRLPSWQAPARRGRRRHDGARAPVGAEAETITAASHLKELRQIGIRAWAVLELRDRRLICDRLHRDLDNEAIARRLQAVGRCAQDCDVACPIALSG